MSIIYKIKKSEDRREIQATFDKEVYGRLTMEFFSAESGFFWFDGILSEEQYDDIFDSNPFIVIENVKVDSDMQKEGIGNGLMIHAIKAIEQTKIKTVVLNACPIGSYISKDSLVKWYSKFGFKIFKDQGGNTVMIKRL